MSNHDKWRFEATGQLSVPVHIHCDWPTSRLNPAQYLEQCGQVGFDRMKRLLFCEANHRPQYAVRHEEGDEDVKKTTVSDALGLKALLEDGGRLRNLREHAARIRDEIVETAQEVGGKPARSSRYLDACAVTVLVDQIEQIAAGTYVHTVSNEEVS